MRESILIKTRVASMMGLAVFFGAFAPPAQADEKQNQNLLKAVAKGDLEDALKALDKGADPNLKNAQNVPVVVSVASTDQVGLAVALLSRGGDPNAPDPAGRTALMTAVLAGRGRMVQALLSNRADVKAVAPDGTTAMDLAQKRGDPEILRLLTAAGAAPTQAAPAVKLLPDPNGKVLFEDFFQQANPKWRSYRGQWVAQGGNLVQVRDEAKEGNTIYFYDPVSMADGEVTARVQMIVRMPKFTTREDEDLLRVRRRIAGAGIVFRYQDESNFYLFRLAGEEGVVLGKMQNGQWSDLANPRASDLLGKYLEADRDYVLRVRMDGKRIQCWIDERAAVNLEDGTFSVGRAGLSTFRTQAAYKAFRITER